MAYAPPLVNYLPNRVSLLSDNAPPPRNPKLGYCVDQYVADQLKVEGAGILARAEAIQSLDMSILPRKLRSSAEKAFEAVPVAIASLEEAQANGQAVVDATTAYRPQHTAVRALEREVRGLDHEIKEIETTMSRLRGEDLEARRAGLEAKIAELTHERDEIAAQIPGDWPDVYAAFADLQKAETDAFRTYSRAATDANAPLTELIGALRAGDDFRALEDRLRAARAEIEAAEPEDMVEPLNDLAKAFGAVDGADDVQKGVSGARRALKARTPDKEKALKSFDKALEAYDEQLAWRATAEADLLAPLVEYQAGMSTSLGIREQEKFTREQALYVAGCLSHHRDISLNF